MIAYINKKYTPFLWVLVKFVESPLSVENLAHFTLKEENLFSLIRLQKLVTHIYHGRLVYFVLLINANIMEIQTKIPPVYFNTRPHLQMSFNLRIFQFVFLGVLVRNTQPRVLNWVKVISKCWNERLIVSQ